MRIKPGAPGESIVPYLAGRRITNEIYGQMPPTDSHVVDVESVTKVSHWIQALP